VIRIPIKVGQASLEGMDDERELKKADAEFHLLILSLFKFYRDHSAHQVGIVPSKSKGEMKG